MGTRTAGSQNDRKDSRSYKPKLSEAEKATCARKAVAAHYRSHPELKEKNKLAKRASRAAKKLAKRKWDPPKKQKEVTMEIFSDEEILTSEEEHDDIAFHIRGPRTPSPTVSEMCGVAYDAEPSNNLEPQGEDEEVASQVLTSMYLARQRQIEISSTSGDGTCALPRYPDGGGTRAMATTGQHYSSRTQSSPAIVATAYLAQAPPRSPRDPSTHITGLGVPRGMG